MASVLWAVMAALLMLVVPVCSPSQGLPGAKGTLQQGSIAEAMMEGASRSLAEGAGPAMGHPYSCTSIGTLSMGCADRSHQTSTRGSTIGWQSICAINSCPPPARGAAGMAYDPETGYVVLFGGIINMTLDPNTTFSDTWIFENGVWHRLNVTGPCARLGEYVAYDYTDNYVLLFGGGPYLTLNSSLYYNDTWKFQNGTWTELYPDIHPNARGLGAMAYDPLDGYLLMYGGMSGATNFHNDTWTYSDGQWHNLSVTKSPPRLVAPTMAYDPAEHYVLLFGGASPSTSMEFGDDLDQTWSYVHGTWTNLSSSIQGSVPDGRKLASMAYDPAQGLMILFGGWNTTNDNYYGDTWTFVDGVWSHLFVSPTPATGIIGADLISTQSSAGLLLFGGLVGTSSSYEASNATWSFGPLPPSVRPVPYVVSFETAPSNTCPSVVFNGSTEKSGNSTSVVPGPYNATARACPGYAFAGWFVSGGVDTTAQGSATTTVDVTGNGTLTAYYQHASTTSNDFSALNLGLVVAGACVLSAVLIWGYRRLSR